MFFHVYSHGVGCVCTDGFKINNMCYGCRENFWVF